MKTEMKLSILFASLILTPATVSAAGVTGQVAPQFTVSREVKRDVSLPMREILANLPAPQPGNPDDTAIPNIFLDLDDNYNRPGQPIAPPSQPQFSGLTMPGVDLAVNGLNRNLGGGGTPPDTTGDVSPDHYFQWVNTSWALFDKTTGALVSGPNPGNSFFVGFGGFCETTNRGDPLVLWDEQAERWVVSQFGFTSTSSPPWFQCVAVSTSSDPLGSYHRYAFEFPNFPDYGKMGVWITEDGGQNAYLFSMHEFNGSFQGGSFNAVERDKMLNGQSAQFIRLAGGPLAGIYGAIPFHLEGPHPLTSGTCPMFVHFASNGAGYDLWDVCIDWRTSSASFDPNPTLVNSDPFTIGLTGIPQLDSTTRLDDFGSNTMYLAGIRAFGPEGPVEAQGVINHSVDVGGDQAGGRWINFGFTTGPQLPPVYGPDHVFTNGFDLALIDPTKTEKRIIDQGTYAPDDSSRWMGGINMDQSGNIAFGYNVSSASMNPEIRIAGRLRNDPPGVLRDETQCTAMGTGAQTGTFGGRPRWGDYATMGVDPADQCTFWFTNEYYPVTSFGTWDTRICKLAFPGCGDPDFLLELADNGVQAVCQADLEGSVRVGAFGALSEDVTLGEGTVRGSFGIDFDDNILAAGESSAFTVTGSSGLDDGVYSAIIEGLSGPLIRTVEVQFGVSAETPDIATLTSPANEGTGESTRPTYSWSAALGSNTYLIEVASDLAFTAIVDSAEVEDTSYVSSILLENETEYFWRVTANNFCGPGVSSDIASFTTGIPGSCPGGTSAANLFFDDVSGDLPWTVDNISGDVAALWSRVIPPAGTGIVTRAWHAPNSVNSSADQRLTSPPVVLPVADLPIVLAYDAFHLYETNGPVNCWDGGFVEYSINGGSNWFSLGNGRNLADPYPGTLSAGSNPLGNEPVWCNQPAGGNSVETVFSLDEFAGETIQFRFRSTSDNNTAPPAPNGWAIDNIRVQSCED